MFVFGHGECVLKAGLIEPGVDCGTGDGSELGGCGKCGSCGKGLYDGDLGWGNLFHGDFRIMRRSYWKCPRGRIVAGCGRVFRRLGRVDLFCKLVTAGRCERGLCFEGGFLGVI